MQDSTFKALKWQWENSTRKNLRLCGQVPISKSGYVLLYADNRSNSAIISGVRRCSSASACVNCSTRIAKARGEWLSEIFAKATEKGYTISLLTLTVRHKRKDSLDTLLEAMKASYTNIQGTRAFSELRTKYGADFVRVLEVTYGKNGFHPHFHIAIIHKPFKKDDPNKWADFKNELTSAWVENIQKTRKVRTYAKGQKNEAGKPVYIYKEVAGLEAPVKEVAVHIWEESSLEQQAWYLTKANGLSSLEITNSRSKIAGAENVNIWELHGLAVAGEKLSIGTLDINPKFVWTEYENSIKGFRIISTSRGMAERWGVMWKSDEEISQDEFSDNSQMPISYIM